MNQQIENIKLIITTIGRPSLERSINSLLNQTNQNWECIVVFDNVEIILFPTNHVK
jgi:glycosyltransferase involved in cell wall biosynthesis